MGLAGGLDSARHRVRRVHATCRDAELRNRNNDNNDNNYNNNNNNSNNNNSDNYQ